jgi:hypothetical protein
MSCFRLSVGFFLAATTSVFAAESFPASSHPMAEPIFAARRNTPLTEQEEAIVGKWRCENPEFSWEIDRRPDGTYTIVYHEDYDGEIFDDYARGIWGILNGHFYYADLESSAEDYFFENTPSFERIVDISPERFLTLSHGYGEEPTENDEHRVDSFQYALWKTYEGPSKPAKSAPTKKGG